MDVMASSFTAILAQAPPPLPFPHSSKLSRSTMRLCNKSSNSPLSFLKIPRISSRNPASPRTAPSSSTEATVFRASASSSTMGAPNEEMEASPSRSVEGSDLLIVGPGVLGRLVAEQWRKEHPECQIFGQTMTADHHDELISMGINPFLRGAESGRQFPYVIFCAPPSQTTDYPGDVKLAASNWNGEGSFLFTSSSVLYDCNDNGPCDEDTPVIPIGRTPRTDILLQAEQVVLEFGGCILRLAGLYKADRGAHNYYLEKGIVEVRPDYILNLIHYEDAASLSVAILKRQLHCRIFLGCDNHPLSRQEMMDLVNRSGKFGKKFQGFTGSNGPLGKRLNNSKTRNELRWEPKYTSYAQFLGISQ